jgi:3-oxo-5alpha-steroid 4-dehydrogenase
LAEKIGVEKEKMLRTVEEYNVSVQTPDGDLLGKSKEYCIPVSQPPFYAIDISITRSGISAVRGITLGGLRVDGETGMVLNEKGTKIQGLYAAGRNAVGICSNSYVSGLSLADCVFSGKRAGEHAAKVALEGS